MKTLILEDLWRYEGSRCHNLLIQIRYYLFTPGFRYSYFLRQTQLAKNPVSRILWSCRLHICSHRYGFQIPWQTKIGRGFRLAHFGQVVVNPGSVIGEDVTIAQGTLIGNSQGKRGGVPTIGNRCQIGANAIVVGGIQVGNDVLIAPGAFVNFDVPDNSIVIGNPGRIITKEQSPTTKYIVYSVHDFR